MSVTWRRLGPAVLAGPDAVALPQVLLDGMAPSGPPVASWSYVDRTVLVLGRAARDPVLNPAAAERLGVEVVRRRSGGGPVLWDAELVSFDVVLPPGHPLAHRDLAMAYRWIGEAVAEGVATLGVPVRVVGVDEAHAAQRRTDATSVRAARACFGGLSPFEVVGPDDRKVVGLSQVRRRTGALFQCGVPLSFDAPLLAELLEPDPAERAALRDALDGAATGLRSWLPGVRREDVVRAVEAALQRREGIRLAPAAQD